MAQTPKIKQGLGRFLSCGARKPEQTLKDLLIIVDSEPSTFFSKLRKLTYRRPRIRTHGHRCVRPTLYLLHHSRLQADLTTYDLKLIKYYFTTT